MQILLTMTPAFAGVVLTAIAEYIRLARDRRLRRAGQRRTRQGDGTTAK